MTSIGKQFTVTREMLAAVAGDQSGHLALESRCVFQNLALFCFVISLVQRGTLNFVSLESYSAASLTKATLQNSPQI